LGKRESNKGAFDVLEAARNSANKIVFQNEILQFQRVIISALDLDAQLEHAIFLMTRRKWQSWLNLIETLAQLLAAESLLNLCKQQPQIASQSTTLLKELRYFRYFKIRKYENLTKFS
jgi:hypothetical protein